MPPIDPKWLAAIIVPALGGLCVWLYNAGKKSVSAGYSKELEQLHADLETAHSTPDPKDDEAVLAKIRATERMKAAIDALPAA